MLSQAHTGMLSVRVSASSTSSKSSKDKSPKLDLRCCYKSCAVNQPDNKDKRSICVAGGGLNVVPSNLDSGTKKDFPRPTWCCEQDCSVWMMATVLDCTQLMKMMMTVSFSRAATTLVARTLDYGHGQYGLQFAQTPPEFSAAEMRSLSTTVAVAFFKKQANKSLQRFPYHTF